MSPPFAKAIARRCGFGEWVGQQQDRRSAEKYYTDQFNSIQGDPDRGEIDHYDSYPHYPEYIYPYYYPYGRRRGVRRIRVLEPPLVLDRHHRRGLRDHDPGHFRHRPLHHPRRVAGHLDYNDEMDEKAGDVFDDAVSISDASMISYDRQRPLGLQGRHRVYGAADEGYGGRIGHDRFLGGHGRRRGGRLYPEEVLSSRFGSEESF